MEVPVLVFRCFLLFCCHSEGAFTRVCGVLKGQGDGEGSRAYNREKDKGVFEEHWADVEEALVIVYPCCSAHDRYVVYSDQLTNLFATAVGFNFLSHGSQDLYPTYLQTSKGFSAHNATVATIIGTCGAIRYVSTSMAHVSRLLTVGVGG